MESGSQDDISDVVQDGSGTEDDVRSDNRGRLDAVQECDTEDDVTSSVGMGGGKLDVVQECGTEDSARSDNREVCIGVETHEEPKPADRDKSSRRSRGSSYSRRCSPWRTSNKVDDSSTLEEHAR